MQLWLASVDLLQYVTWHEKIGLTYVHTKLITFSDFKPFCMNNTIFTMASPERQNVREPAT